MVRPLVLLVTLAMLAAGCEVFPVAAPTWAEECVGVPQDVCDRPLREAREAARELAPQAIGVRVRCVAASCTQVSGQIEVEALLPDGRTVSLGSSGWASPIDPPDQPEMPVPVPPGAAPACLAVPRDRCVELAESARGETRAQAVAITVRCTTTCTDQRGEGETLVTLADGSVVKSGWAYESSP